MDSNIQPEIDTIWDEAKSYIEQRDFDKAIETYRYILIRYDDSPLAVECANANLGDIYLTIGQLDPAEIYLKKALSCDPRKPDYHYLLGFVYSKRSQWKNAIKQFQASIDVEPDNPEYLRGLGWAMFNSGYKSQGLKYLHEANELKPSNVNVLLDLSNAYLMIFDFDKAALYAERALLIDPKNELAKKVRDKIKELRKLFEQGKGVT